MIREDIPALARDLREVVLRYKLGAKVTDEFATSIACDLVDTGSHLIEAVGTVTDVGVDRAGVTVEETRNAMDMGDLLRDCGSKLIQLVKSRRQGAVPRWRGTAAKPVATEPVIRDSKSVWKAMSPEECDAERVARYDNYRMREQGIALKFTELELLERAEAERQEHAREARERAEQERLAKDFDPMSGAPLGSWLTPQEEQARMNDLAEKEAIGRGIKLGERW